MLLSPHFIKRFSSLLLVMAFIGISSCKKQDEPLTQIKTPPSEYREPDYHLYEMVFNDSTIKYWDTAGVYNERGADENGNSRFYCSAYVDFGQYIEPKHISLGISNDNNECFKLDETVSVQRKLMPKDESSVPQQIRINLNNFTLTHRFPGYAKLYLSWDNRRYNIFLTNHHELINNKGLFIDLYLDGEASYFKSFVNGVEKEHSLVVEKLEEKEYAFGAEISLEKNGTYADSFITLSFMDIEVNVWGE